MQLKHYKLSDINPAKYNPRKITDKELSGLIESIKKFGMIDPLIVNIRDGKNVLVGGHQRLKVAEILKMETVPVVEVDLSISEEKALNVALNSPTLSGKYDENILSGLLDEIKVDLPDLFEDLNFGDFDIDIPVEKIEGKTDDDAVPEMQPDPITKRGDIWLLGKHRLMCGDSTSIDDMEKLTQKNLVDMWLTDPPYNVAYEGKTKDSLTIQNDSMGNDDFRQFLVDCCTAADAVMKPGAVFYIWHADSEGYNFRGAAFDAGWKVRQCLIWKKSTIVMGRQDYHSKHEPCLYGWKDGAGHLWASDRKQSTILEFDKPSRNAEHSTMKPVELFEYQLLNNTKGGDIVLDSFCGSGTTIIAAEKNGRIGYGMELDERYCDVIIKRWQDYTGKEAILESTGETYNSPIKE